MQSWAKGLVYEETWVLRRWEVKHGNLATDELISIKWAKMFRALTLRQSLPECFYCSKNTQSLYPGINAGLDSIFTPVFAPLSKTFDFSRVAERDVCKLLQLSFHLFIKKFTIYSPQNNTNFTISSANHRDFLLIAPRCIAWNTKQKRTYVAMVPWQDLVTGSAYLLFSMGLRRKCSSAKGFRESLPIYFLRDSSLFL